MKNRFLAALVALMLCAFLSCNKSNDAGPITLLRDSLPKIVSLYLPLVHGKEVQYFTYDKQSRLTGIRAYTYDTSGGSPVIDSSFVSLTLDASLNPPAAYTEIRHFQGDPPAGNTVRHELFYDGLNRVTIDSITVSDQNDFSVQHYRYDNNGNTFIDWLFGDPHTAGSYVVNQTDTIHIQSENIITDINYTVNDGALNHLYTRSYSTHLNPVYNTVLANSLGCLMVFNNFLFDFRSKYLPVQFDSQEQGEPDFTLTYLWTTDATGNVVSGIGTDKNTGTIQQIYRYTY